MQIRRSAVTAVGRFLPPEAWYATCNAVGLSVDRLLQNSPHLRGRSGGWSAVQRPPSFCLCHAISAQPRHPRRARTDRPCRSRRRFPHRLGHVRARETGARRRRPRVHRLRESPSQARLNAAVRVRRTLARALQVLRACGRRARLAARSLVSLRGPFGVHRGPEHAGRRIASARHAFGTALLVTPRPIGMLSAHPSRFEGTRAARTPHRSFHPAHDGGMPIAFQS